MKVLFWFSVIVVLYIYIGYPVVVAVWARVAKRAGRRGFAPGQWPSISIVLAARNEASRLPARIINLLDQRYPGEREIIVVSDGPAASTRTALADFGDRIRLIEVPTGGKPQALNAGVQAARGEIVLFADARQSFAPNAVVELVRNFADPSVGGATGELVLDCELPSGAAPDSEIAEGVGLYWKYEKWIRRNESRVWSTVGATGAIYALRRSLWRPLPPRTLLDDVLAPMRAVLAGSRIVFDERAIAFDWASTDAASEARRKTRTLAGNYQILGLEPRLLVPFVNPVWVQYVSHKLGRLIVPWVLLVLLLASLSLAPGGGYVYLIALALQVTFYGLAAAGAWLSVRERPARVALTFVMMNYSAIAGLAALRRGREVWR
jgi:cellulose synthase/poly-beta-1,6-N-acetylglucosamine synthase-like glycosyltransferase